MTYPLFLPKIRLGKEVRSVSDPNTVFTITREDVIGCAAAAGYPSETITEDVLHKVKTGMEFGLECWRDVIKEAIAFALKS